MQNKETVMGSDAGPTVLPPAACRYSFGVCEHLWKIKLSLSGVA